MNNDKPTRRFITWSDTPFGVSVSSHGSDTLGNNTEFDSENRTSPLSCGTRSIDNAKEEGQQEDEENRLFLVSTQVRSVKRFEES